MYSSIIKEGPIYEILNFIIRDATGIHKTVSSRMAIVLTNSTILRHLIDGDHQIPRHKFELIDLRDVYSISRDVTNFNSIGDICLFSSAHRWFIHFKFNNLYYFNF